MYPTHTYFVQISLPRMLCEIRHSPLTSEDCSGTPSLFLCFLFLSPCRSGTLLSCLHIKKEEGAPPSADPFGRLSASTSYIPRLPFSIANLHQTAADLDIKRAGREGGRRHDHRTWMHVVYSLKNLRSELHRLHRTWTTPSSRSRFRQGTASNLEPISLSLCLSLSPFFFFLSFTFTFFLLPCCRALCLLLRLVRASSLVRMTIGCLREPSSSQNPTGRLGHQATSALPGDKDYRCHQF
ncbi:uncharacterized protein LY79DRAFT_294758 [Colletotrichum navitas]|uniref:Transmembrane protein n=1 Tax=Colletotrichum navitas TaxID=681940 RepID=A0AAD8PU57_9PEZI|nr:uncharacterized protein LY79DRAFT_294758 [Colletotrichum navitas]KAK1584777.1 hypothetical protein LY79DRAFT_294758 [Colletotrichum navitas]